MCSSDLAVTSAANAPVEAGPSKIAPIELMEESAPEKSKSSALKVPHKELEFIIRHASGKHLSSEQIAKVEYYARDLKYLKGKCALGPFL